MGHGCEEDSKKPEPGGRYLKVKVGDKVVSALIDTGADETLVKLDCLPQGTLTYPLENKVKLADGSDADIVGCAVLDIEIAKCVQKVTVLVSRKLYEDCLIGARLLTQLGAKIDMSTGLLHVRTVTVPLQCSPMSDQYHVSRVVVTDTVVVKAQTEMVFCGDVRERRLQGQTCLLEPELPAEDKLGVCVARLAVKVDDYCVPIRVSNVSSDDVKVYKGTHIANVQIVGDDAVQRVGHPNPSDLSDFDKDLDRVTEHLTMQDRNDFKQIMMEYKEVFTGLGRTSIAEHCIPTGDNRPIFQNYRPVPGHIKGKVAEQLSRLVDSGVVRPVPESEWASPLVVVSKPHSKDVRICGDYRRLNRITTPCVQVIPHIESCLQKLSGAKLFTSLDLAQAYHQMPLHDADRAKTTVTTEFGLFEYQSCPYGLQGLPHSFNRAVALALSGVSVDVYVQYFDDILVLAKDMKEMKSNLRTIFQCLQDAGFTLSLRKIRLCQKEVKFLGFLVSSEGVACDPEKTRLIRDWPQPTTVKQVRSFLGLASYVRKFIPRFAELAKPLTRLTEKGVPFVWTSQTAEAFQALKAALASPPVLAHPSFEKGSPSFIIDTDASGVAIGACLTQNDRVIAYASRPLTKAERQYSVTKRELLAVVWGVQHFKQFLVGSKFILRTDHAALQWLFNFKNPEGQIARWLLILSELDFVTRHRKGVLHRDGDALSRYPHPEETDCSDGVTYRWIRVPVTSQDADVRGSGPVTEVGQAEPLLTDEFQGTPVLRAVTSETEQNVNESSIQGMTIQQLSHEQDRDDGILEIKAWKRKRVRPREKHLRSEGATRLVREWRRLVVRGEEHPVLYRRTQTVRGAPTCLQMVVPQHLRREILEALHCGYGGGHQGSDRLEKLVRQRFFWPGIQSEVRAFCQQCEVCEKRRDAPRGSEAPMGSLQSDGFMDRLDIDLVGPLPASEPDGYKYVLTCIDSFTRFSWAFPLPNQEARTIALALMENVISVFGIPRSIHSDQGRNLTGKVMTELYSLLGIHSSTTSGYHPEGNSYSERSHRVLMAAVAKMCADHPKTWPTCLGPAVLSMNANVHDSIGMSPYEAVFGRQVKLPVDRTFGEGAQVAPDQSGEPDILSYVKRLQETIDSTDQLIRDASVSAHEKSKVLHDSRLVESVFEVDDRVWLRKQVFKRGETPKLSWRWEGPYRVLEKRRGWTYRIGKEGAGGVSKVVHHNRLKLCVSTPTVPQRHSARGDESVRPVEARPRDRACPDPIPADTGREYQRYRVLNRPRETDLTLPVTRHADIQVTDRQTDVFTGDGTSDVQTDGDTASTDHVVVDPTDAPPVQNDSVDTGGVTDANPPLRRSVRERRMPRHLQDYVLD